MAEFSVDLVARFAQYQDALDKMVRDSAKAAKGIEDAFAQVRADRLTRIANEQAEAAKRIAREHELAAKRIRDAFGKVRDVFALVGVSFGVSELVNFTKTAAEAVDALGKVAQRTGIAVESLQTLRFAAALGDVSFEELTTSLQHFNQAIDQGSPAFRRLGIDINQFKTPEEKLRAVADAFSKTQDGAAKTAIVLQLFGRAGAALIPILNEGSEGLDKYAAELKELGLATPEQIRRSQELNDALTRSKFIIEGLALTLVPAFAQIVEAMNEAIKRGGILVGVFRALGEAGKIFLFGVDLSPLEKQKQFVTDLREELRKLKLEQAVVRRTPSELESKLSPRFAGSIGKLTTPSDETLKKRIATLEQTLASAEAALKLQEEQAAKKDGKPIGPDPNDEIKRNRARLQQRIADAQQFAQQQQEVENTAFARNERSYEGHFGNLTKITRKELRARISATDEAIAAETDAQAKAGKDTPERLQHELELIKLRGERARLENQAAFVEQSNNEKLVDAQRQYIDAIEETNAAIKEQAGLLEQAVIERQNSAKHIAERLRLVTEGGRDSQAVRDFDARDAAERQQARLNQLLSVEETQRKQTNTQIDLAADARDEEAGSIAAEIRFLEERNRIMRESIPLEQALIDQREAELAQTPAGPARNKLAADLAERKRQLDATKRATETAANAVELYGLHERKLATIFQEEATAEQDIQNQRASGALTTQAAIERTDAARRRYLPTLRAELEAEEALAEARPFDEELQARINATRVAIEKLAATSNEAGRQIEIIFEDAFVDPFEDLINHVKTADQALKAFFNNIAQSLLHLASKNIAESLFGGLFSNTSASGDKGIVGLLGSFAGIFGGASTGAVTTKEQAGITQQQYADYYRKAKGGIVGPEGDMPLLRRFASGGIARHPMFAEFGEGSRPEAYVPLPDGRSIPVTMNNAWQGTRIQVGPSAMTGRQERSAPAVTLQVHPDAMHMTLRDWFEGEMARQAATR